MTRHRHKTQTELEAQNRTLNESSCVPRLLLWRFLVLSSIYTVALLSHSSPSEPIHLRIADDHFTGVPPAVRADTLAPIVNLHSDLDITQLPQLIAHTQPRTPYAPPRYDTPSHAFLFIEDT
jgi:hypothetical protein